MAKNRPLFHLFSSLHTINQGSYIHVSRIGSRTVVVEVTLSDHLTNTKVIN